MMTSVRTKVSRLRQLFVGRSFPLDTLDINSVNLPRRVQVRKGIRLNGLGVRDIPIFQFPVRDVPRLDREKGYLRINDIISPSILRS